MGSPDSLILREFHARETGLESLAKIPKIFVLLVKSKQMRITFDEAELHPREYGRSVPLGSLRMLP